MVERGTRPLINPPPKKKEKKMGKNIGPGGRAGGKILGQLAFYTWVTELGPARPQLEISRKTLSSFKYPPVYFLLSVSFI